MKYILIWGLIAAGAVFIIGVFQVYGYDPATADFLVKCALSIGTLSAVLFALFGGYLRETLDPIRVRIEVPQKEANNDFDENPNEGRVYCHHLRVLNQTPYKPIKNSRVWLKSISPKKLNGEWDDEIMRFAVPRLMEWAPSEWDKDNRTFSIRQVFDLGKTFANDGGFLITIDGRQGAAKARLKKFPVGTTHKCVFYVTADNYQKEEEFSFAITVLPFANGQPQPAQVALIKKSFFDRLKGFFFTLV